MSNESLRAWSESLDALSDKDGVLCPVVYERRAVNVSSHADVSVCHFCVQVQLFSLCFEHVLMDVVFKVGVHVLFVQVDGRLAELV